MNGHHHESLTRKACEALRIPQEQADPLIAASSAPDHLSDVLCRVPFEAPEPHLFGRQLTSLLHFQLPKGEGYCWQGDASLSVLEGIGDLGMRVTRMTVLGTSVPMLRACSEQPGTALCDFRFPSAARVGGFYAVASRDTPAWMGFALHFVQDACVPHHAWGVLRFGHQDHENEQEKEWGHYVQALRNASQPGMLELCPIYVEAMEACRRIGSIELLIEANAEWSRARFGEPHDFPECSPLDAIAIGCRAVAATIRAINLMTVAGS